MDTLTGSESASQANATLTRATAMEAHGGLLEEVCLRLDTIRHRLASSNTRAFGDVHVSGETGEKPEAEPDGQVNRNSMLVDAIFRLVNDIDKEVDRLITVV